MAVGWAYLFPPLSSGGASLAQPWLRFHIPLIEPDVQISRIRLSDKGSRLRPRLAAPACGQAYQADMAVQVREWIAPAPSSPDLVLETQPPARPLVAIVAPDGALAALAEFDAACALLRPRQVYLHEKPPA